MLVEEKKLQDYTSSLLSDIRDAILNKKESVYYEALDGYEMVVYLEDLNENPTVEEIEAASKIVTCCGNEINDLEETLGLCPNCKEHL